MRGRRVVDEAERSIRQAIERGVLSVSRCDFWYSAQTFRRAARRAGLVADVGGGRGKRTLWRRRVESAA